MKNTFLWMLLLGAFCFLPSCGDDELPEVIEEEEIVEEVTEVPPVHDLELLYGKCWESFSFYNGGQYIFYEDSVMVLMLEGDTVAYPIEIVGVDSLVITNPARQYLCVFEYANNDSLQFRSYEVGAEIIENNDYPRIAYPCD